MIYLVTTERRQDGKVVGLAGYAVEADSRESAMDVMVDRLPAGCAVVHATPAPDALAPYLGPLLIRRVH